MRDLTRARDDMKSQERKARQQLNAFVLRHGHSWPSGKTRWGKPHYNWLEELKFEHPWQQVVLQEYIDAVKAATQRVADLTDQMMGALPQWSWLRSQVLWLPFAVSTRSPPWCCWQNSVTASSRPGN